jgi:hypothetical protein
VGADALLLLQFESLEQDLHDRVAKRAGELILRDADVVDFLNQDVWLEVIELTGIERRETCTELFSLPSYVSRH